MFKLFKPQEPSLAIVIPTCRPFKALKTIENAVKICYPGRKEVIVVVNGKGLKRHAKEIKRLFPQVKVIYIERRNKAAALNAGVKATRCSLVAVLDDDVLVPGETLKGAVDRAYKVIQTIHFDGAHFRKDIARKGLKRLGVL